MAGQEAVWHVAIDDKQQGPLTKEEVLEHLRAGTLIGTDLIWRPGFSEWTPVQDTEDFWQPPKRVAMQAAITEPRSNTISVGRDHEVGKGDAYDREKWSLWKAANIGLIVSGFSLLIRIPSEHGFELASYAHTASAETIAALAGEILAVPAIFFLIALVRNLFFFRQPKSSKSAFWGALTFTALLVCITAALTLYQEIFFNRTEVISGATKKSFIAESVPLCVQKQRSLRLNVEDNQIYAYCTCVSEKLADTTSYKMLGAERDASGLADLKQRSEWVGSGCRL